MAGGYKNINGTDGNTFSSTNQPENAGRKKKIYTILKEKGYSSDDVKTAFKEIAFYTFDEIQELYSNEKLPIITRIIGNQLFLALDKGDWTKIKEIMEYILGKPTQPLEHSGETTQTINLSSYTYEQLKEIASGGNKGGKD
jgi:hypothetical protein